MRINSNGIFSDRAKRAAIEKQDNRKDGVFLGQQKNRAALEQKPLGESLISRQELLSLAADFKSGSIDKVEANNRFVSAVINGSLGGKLSESDLKKIIDDIAEFSSEDRDFLQKLENNLNSLI